MKKWQELSLSGISNFSIALVVSGVVALVIEGQSVLGAIALIVSGAYLFGYSVIQAKALEER
ncbi:MAG: hypothetical protein AB7E49_09700 [Campylobacterales bacterium]